jgi:nitroreductase
MFSRPVQELIQTRVSTRTYSKTKQVEESTRKELIDFCSRLGPSPFGDKARFYIAAVPDRKENHVGTYGAVQNAQAFIYGVISRSERCYESYGFLFEQVILKATDIGLATCWLGIFTLPDSFGAGNIKGDEIVPAISPLGYKSSAPVPMGFIMRGVSQRTKRRQFSELFYDRDFRTPLSTEQAGVFATPLEMVRLGPSAGNRQPWRVVVDKDVVHFYIDMSNVPENYKNLSLHLIDLGIALSHFELTCLELKLRGRYLSVNQEKRPHAEDRYRYGISWKST